MPYKPTKKQGKAWRLLREGPRHVMLVGGSRSGKTTVIDEEIICRALQYPGSRHLIARLRFAHIKPSIWMDTIPKIFEMEGLRQTDGDFNMNQSDHYVKFPNGSEIWIDGLDDKERRERILGREYASIHLNEISQIAYDTTLLLKTRLAQNIKGCRNKIYYDLNPVGRMHWAYQLFVQGKDPKTGQPIDDPNDYAYMVINPIDNQENLDSTYLKDLQSLPEHQRKRFWSGEWGDPEGIIFTNWQVIDEIPEKVLRHAKVSYGLDFGFSVNPSALVWEGLIGDDLYLDELLYEPGLTNQMLATRIKQIGPTDRIYADSAEPKSIQELQIAGVNVRGAAKGKDSVHQGLNWLLAKNIYVTRRSSNLQIEFMNYEWKRDVQDKMLPEPVKDYDHAIDATRYGSEPLKEKKQARPILRNAR